MIRVSKFRRPNGYWYVRYWSGAQPLDESARTKSETQAETYRLRREIEINAGIQPLRHGDVTELIDQYLGAMPPKTSDSHRGEALRILNALLRICGTKRRDGSVKLQTGQLTPELVDRFIVRRQRYQLYDGTRKSTLGRRVVRKRAVSNVTLRKELRYLSGFLNWCCRQRPPYLRENPFPLSNASSIRNDARPHHMITDTESRG